jgi:hypothetical protein
VAHRVLCQTPCQIALWDSNTMGELPPGGGQGSGSERQSVASTVANAW